MPARNRLGDNTGRHFKEVSRFKLQVRDHQEARNIRGGGDDRPTPMAWGWSLDTAYQDFQD